MTAVLFSPDDLALVREGAAVRRRLMDTAISQLRPGYAAALSDFNRLYEQKSAILRDWHEKPSLLDTLDDFSERLCRLSARLTRYRAAFSQRLAEAAAQQVVSSDIAYVQVEAVLAQCDLYKNEGVALQEKTEKAQKSWAQREQNLQAEAAQLQQKYEKGLITSRDAQAQQESIQKKVASYQSNAQKEAQTLDEENYVFTNRAQDLLHRAVQEINSGKKYKLIINASALIDADSTLNITPAVLAKVNELYAADKKAVKK